METILLLKFFNSKGLVKVYHNDTLLPILIENRKVVSIGYRYSCFNGIV